jgi:2-C-methyl-D-erythritol 4-phosphate cytidylyltransferase
MTASSWAIVIASGKDEMLNSETCTAFLNLNNKPVLSYSLSALEHCQDIDGVIVVAPKDRLEQVVSVIQLFGCHKVRKVVPGGTTEYASFSNAMKYVDEDASMIVVHEASRPGIRSAEISEIIKSAKRSGLTMAGKPVAESTAVVGKTGMVEEYTEAGTIWTYGSPVAFKRETLDKMTAALRKKKKTAKTLHEGLEAANLKFKLAAVKHFPLKLDTPEQLRAMEQTAMPI